MTLVVTDTAFVQTGRTDGRTVDQFTAVNSIRKTARATDSSITSKNACVFLAAGAIEIFIGSFMKISLPKTEHEV